jgi:hypothetical protein
MSAASVNVLNEIVGMNSPDFGSWPSFGEGARYRAGILAPIFLMI